jgi:hypothetical protein
MRLPLAAALLASAALCACAKTTVVDTAVHQARHAQELSPSNSMLGEACDGHDASDSVRLPGHTRFYVHADVFDLSGGTRRRAVLIAGPADEGLSQVAHPAFTGVPGQSSCGGHALRTFARRENGALYLDWALELAPPPGQPGATTPWEVSGRSRFDTATGTASGETAFVAFGTPMLVRIAASPGPVWVAEKRAELARAAIARHPYPSFAAPLPDERPGLTLDDVTRPGAR